MLQWSLLAAYFVVVAVRTLVRGRNVALFEIVQVAAALIIAFVGTSMLTQATGVLPAAIGVISLAIGAACYVVTVRVPGRTPGLRAEPVFLLDARTRAGRRRPRARGS